MSKVRQFPRRYLVWGSVLFVAYELCLALSICYAQTSRQAIEVGMVNCLWPALTLVFAITFTVSGSIYLLLAAAAMGFGYAAWNVGILHGNIAVLVGASYFIPVLSALLSAVVLHIALPFSFWQGAAMVCVGSILCWVATRTARPDRAPPT